MPKNFEKQKPWHSYVTIDLLLKVANYTILHPFVAWIIPLSLRAQAYPTSHITYQVSTAWAILLTILFFLSVVNQRLAYGIPREVDTSDEVIVITGGASGLGRLIAQFYAMRGASVAVLDIQDINLEEEVRGVSYYQCDVGDAKVVEAVSQRIEKEVQPQSE
jgi:NADPH:quinone reductase-like Zn-dependent oxidoreductase